MYQHGRTPLKRWINWYLNYGIDVPKSRESRRQSVSNLICLYSFSASVVVSTFVIFVDFSLWPVCLLSIAYGVLFLVLPPIFRIARVATWATLITVSLLLLVFVTYLLGKETGVYLLLLSIPASGLMILGPSRIRVVGLFTLLASAAVVYCMVFFGEAALPAARNEVVQGFLLITSVAGTSVVNIWACFAAFENAEQAEAALEAEYARSERLLASLLPGEIARRLKEAPNRVIADQHPQVAILFADIVNFTPRAARMSPDDLVIFLNRIFSAFDVLTERHGLEKIKTIGDAYMVAAGIPLAQKDPAHRVADMALDMLAVTRELSRDTGQDVRVRIGIHAGPVIAGVIGSRKPFYDIWGETVNTAARMESHGKPDRIQVTKTTRDILEQDYRFEARGAVDVKGMGQVETWWLLEKSSSDA